MPPLASRQTGHGNDRFGARRRRRRDLPLLISDIDAPLRWSHSSYSPLSHSPHSVLIACAIGAKIPGDEGEVLAPIAPGNRLEHCRVHADCVTPRRVPYAARAFELESYPLAGQCTRVQDPGDHVLRQRSKRFAMSLRCRVSIGPTLSRTLMSNLESNYNPILLRPMDRLHVRAVPIGGRILASRQHH